MTFAADDIMPPPVHSPSSPELDPEERIRIVADLAMRGFTQKAMAKLLKVHFNTIGADVAKIREQAKAETRQADWRQSIGDAGQFWDSLEKQLLAEVQAAPEGSSVRMNGMMTVARIREMRIQMMMKVGLVPTAWHDGKRGTALLPGGLDPEKMTVEELEKFKDGILGKWAIKRGWTPPPGLMPALNGHAVACAS